MRDEFEKLKGISDSWKSYMNKISQDIKDTEVLLADIGVPSSVFIVIEGEEGIFFMNFDNKKICIKQANNLGRCPLIEMKFEHREFFHAYLGKYLLTVHQYIKERI